MDRRVVGVVVLVTLFSLMGSLTATAQSEEFAMANRFYEDKDFASAVRMYESILNRDVESANLYFNLANAYFKAGDLGHAVLYYSKARRLAPSDEDVAFNLEFAKQFSRVQMQGVQLNPIRSFFVSLVDSYELERLAWMATAFFVLLMVGLIIRFGLGYNLSPVRILMVVSAILLLVAGSLTTFKYRYDYLTRRAVIIADESPVYTGASELSEIELRGAPGLIIEITSESGDFLNVLFENKRRGWIKKDLVAPI